MVLIINNLRSKYIQAQLTWKISFCFQKLHAAVICDENE